MVRLFINGQDAYSNYRASLGNGAMETLMTPAPNKAYIENKSDAADGKEVLISDDCPALVDERDITLRINIEGNDPEDMLHNFKMLCDILRGGKVDLSTDFDCGVVYHLVYRSCQQLQTFFRGKAIFTIQFNEPDPSNRTWQTEQ